MNYPYIYTRKRKNINHRYFIMLQAVVIIVDVVVSVLIKTPDMRMA
jgi:hypothetical protein